MARGHSTHWDNIPDGLLDHSKRRHRGAKRKIGDSDGIYSRLAVMRDTQLQSFVIQLEAVNLGHYRLENALKKQSADTIKRHITNILEPPFWAKLEAGTSGDLHVHVLAFEAPRVAHTSQFVQNLYGLAHYLSKPVCKPTDANKATYRKAKADAKRKGDPLPRISWSKGIPRK